MGSGYARLLQRRLCTRRRLHHVYARCVAKPITISGAHVTHSRAHAYTPRHAPIACTNIHTQCFFLPPVVFPEPSFTPENLSTVLDIMSDSLWKMFGVYTNIPQSELSRIWGQCTSDRECKQALIHTFLSSHPAPSWTLVEWALYMTDYLGEDDTCLRALYHLQQLFPTGTVFSLVWYTHALL